MAFLASKDISFVWAVIAFLRLLSVPVTVSILYLAIPYPSVWTEAFREPSNLPTDKLSLKGAEQ